MWALTRINKVYALGFDRPVLPCERLEAIDIPCIAPETSLGLSGPWSASASALSGFSLNQVSGNSMHLSAIAAVMFYTLACTESRARCPDAWPQSVQLRGLCGLQPCPH